MPVPPETVRVCEYACPVIAKDKAPSPGVTINVGATTTIW